MNTTIVHTTWESLKPLMPVPYPRPITLESQEWGPWPQCFLGSPSDSSAYWFRAVVLKMWSLDQEHEQALGHC